MIKIPAPDPIAFLVNRKFPRLNKPLPAELALRLGMNDGIFSDYIEDEKEWIPPSAETLQKAQLYREKLKSLPKAKIKKQYRDELAKLHFEKDQKMFFNQAEAQADFDYWSKMPSWTLDEAIALSFGKNPKVVYWSRLEKIPSYTSPFVQEYIKLRELALRAKSWGQLYDPVLVGIFIGWAKKNDVPFPKELEEKVIARGNNILDWKKMYDDLLIRNNENVDRANKLLEDSRKQTEKLKEEIKVALENKSATPIEKPLKTRERETLLKMIIGMAVDFYGYDPKASKSTVPKEISDNLDLLGISVSDDTIRKWLREAAEYLPNEPV